MACVPVKITVYQRQLHPHEPTMTDGAELLGREEEDYHKGIEMMFPTHHLSRHQSGLRLYLLMAGRRSLEVGPAKYDQKLITPQKICSAPLLRILRGARSLGPFQILQAHPPTEGRGSQGSQAAYPLEWPWHVRSYKVGCWTM
jgi:hypothetical protein